MNNHSTRAGASPAPTGWDVNNHNIVAGAHASVDMNNHSTRAGASPAPTGWDVNNHNIVAGAHGAGDVNNHSTSAGVGDSGVGIRAGASPAPTIGRIVGAYKSLVANACLNLFKTKNQTMGKLWQRNYHEHIIRSEESYQTISDYIINKPDKWMDDKFFI